MRLLATSTTAMLTLGCGTQIVTFGEPTPEPTSAVAAPIVPITSDVDLQLQANEVIEGIPTDIVMRPVTCPDPERRTMAGAYERREASNPINLDTWHGSGGVVAADLDGDGLLELVAPAEPYAKVFHGRPDHGFDEDRVLLDFELTYGIGGSVADFDGDGDLDLFLLRLFRPNVLLQNRGDGSFDDVTDQALPPQTLHDGLHAPSMSSTWADFDGDGDLDLFVGNYGYAEIDLSSTEPGWPSFLYINQGDGTFADGSDLLPEEVQRGYTYVAGWHDIDGDLWPELYIVNDVGWVQPNTLLRNERGVLVPDHNESGLDLVLSAAGLGVGDVNGDGLPDFLLSEWNDVKLMQSTGAQWLDYGPARGILPDPSRSQQTGWGAELADLDNDGDLDAMVAYGHIGFIDPNRSNPVRQPDALFVQDDDGQFRDAAAGWGVDDDGSNRGFVLADLNDDGWLDIAKRDLDGPSLVYMSRCGDAHWLRMQLRMPGMNTRAVGARVSLEADGRRWSRTILAGGTGYGSGGPPEVHFGLGEIDVIDRVVIRWPDRHTTIFTDVPTNQVATVTRYE